MIRWFNTSLQTVRVAGSALALCLVAGSALAQNVAAHVQPASQTPVAMALKNARLAPVAPTLVELGAWVQPKAAAVDNNDGVRIGAPRASSATGTVAATQAALRWQATAGGGQVAALSFEVRQALNKQRPETLGQASRMTGVTPAAISLLVVHLKKHGLKALAGSAESA